LATAGDVRRPAAHRYFFQYYALGSLLNLKPGLTKNKLLKAKERHALAEGS